jgi:hypothetical protein
METRICPRVYTSSLKHLNWNRYGLHLWMKDSSPNYRREGHGLLSECSRNTYTCTKRTSELRVYQLRNHRLSAKLVLTFVGRWRRLVSTTNSCGLIIAFLDRSRYFFFQVAPRLNSRGWVDLVPGQLLVRKSGSARNRTRTSGSVARISDTRPQTRPSTTHTEAYASSVKSIRRISFLLISLFLFLAFPHHSGQLQRPNYKYGYSCWGKDIRNPAKIPVEGCRRRLRVWKLWRRQYLDPAERERERERERLTSRRRARNKSSFQGYGGWEYVVW